MLEQTNVYVYVKLVLPEIKLQYLQGEKPLVDRVSRLIFSLIVK